MTTIQQLAPKIARAAEIIEKYSHKKEEYILSLSPRANEDLATDSARILAYMKGKDVYDQRKQENKIPMYCRILENILLKDQPLRANIDDDPVYQVLTEVRSKMEAIATKQYNNTRAKADAETGYTDTGEDIEIFINNKVNFVEGLLNIIKYRGIDRTSPASPDWYKDLGLNEIRYDWLTTHLAESTKKDRTKRIKQFVEELPAYDWERFYWPCDQE